MHSRKLSGKSFRTKVEVAAPPVVVGVVVFGEQTSTPTRSETVAKAGYYLSFGPFFPKAPTTVQPAAFHALQLHFFFPGHFDCFEISRQHINLRLLSWEGTAGVPICLSLPGTKVGEKSAKPSDLNKIKV